MVCRHKRVLRLNEWVLFLRLFGCVSYPSPRLKPMKHLGIGWLGSAVAIVDFVIFVVSQWMGGLVEGFHD